MSIDFKSPVLSKLKEIEQSNHPEFMVAITKHDMSDNMDQTHLFRKTQAGLIHIDSVHPWEKEGKIVWARLAQALHIFDEIVAAAIDSTIPIPQEQPLA